MIFRQSVECVDFLGVECGKFPQLEIVGMGLLPGLFYLWVFKER